MRSTRMQRFQIYLEPVMDAHLRRLADKTGKTKAELVRDGVNLLLAQETAKLSDPLLDLVGIGGKTGCTDASERHDEYLYGKPSGKPGRGKNK